MTEYVLDITTDFLVDYPAGCHGYLSAPTMYKYYFKIDKLGNVQIDKERRNPDYGIHEALCIKDNIEIPSFFLPLLKVLIGCDMGSPGCSNLGTSSEIRYGRYWYVIMHFIKSIKKNLASEPILYGQKLIAFQNDFTKRMEQIAALRNEVDTLKQKLREQQEEQNERTKEVAALRNEVDAWKRKVQEQQAEVNESETAKLFHLKGLKKLKEENDFLKGILISLQNEKNMFQVRETLKNLQLS